MEASDYLKTAGVGTLVYTAPKVYPNIDENNVSRRRLRYNKTVDIYSLSLGLHEERESMQPHTPKANVQMTVTTLELYFTNTV